MGTRFLNNAEANARSIAVIAQNEAIWTLFVRSGQAGLIEDAMLQQAQKDLERQLTAKKIPKRSRERRLKGAERIRGYLAEVTQPF